MDTNIHTITQTKGKAEIVPMDNTWWVCGYINIKGYK